MMKKRREEPREGVTSGLSHTEVFVKKITDLLKQGLTTEDYEAIRQAIIELCEDNYDLSRAAAAATGLAEKQSPGSERFKLYSKMAGDLFKMQCESERTSGRTTIFTGFYNSAVDAYLDAGCIKEAVAVTFEHSHWLMTNALYRDEAGKQKYLLLSVKAFDELIKHSEGELAIFIYEQQEGRKKAADALRDMQPPAHLTGVTERTPLQAGAQTYRELIAFLEESCKVYDIASYLSEELATVLKKVMPDLAEKCAALAEKLHQRHVALLDDQGIPS